MQYLIKCTKDNEIKFISHLDFLRTLQRIVRRADINPEFSKGFNPHMLLSIAQPLAVGLYSNGEYFDLNLKNDINETEIKNKLNANCPNGIKILEVVKIIQGENSKSISPMALVKAAQYVMRIPYKNIDNLDESMKKLLAQNEWNTIKKTKKTEKEVDIKKLVKKIVYKVDGSHLYIKALVLCGSNANLSPQLLADYINNNTSYVDTDKFIYIKREEIYTEKNNKFISLDKYFKSN